MYIKNGVYRSVNVAGLTAPILAGTVLTVNGKIASEAGTDAYGIVPENIYVIPPTKLIKVVIGGMIDLDDPMNQGISFSEGVIETLGKDINFVPAMEAGGGSELPAFSASDKGKALMIDDDGDLAWGTPEVTPKPTAADEGKALVVKAKYSGEIFPEQTLLVESYGTTLPNFNEDALVIGKTYYLFVDGTEYSGVYAEDIEGKHITFEMGAVSIVYNLEDEEWRLYDGYLQDGDYTISVGEKPVSYVYWPGELSKYDLVILVPYNEPYGTPEILHGNILDCEEKLDMGEVVTGVCILALDWSSVPSGRNSNKDRLFLMLSHFTAPYGYIDFSSMFFNANNSQAEITVERVSISYDPDTGEIDSWRHDSWPLEKST